MVDLYGNANSPNLQTFTAVFYRCRSSPSKPGIVFQSIYNLIKPLAHNLQAVFTAGDEKSTLMKQLSAACGSQATDIIIKGCLSPSVPTSQSDLSKYKDVVAKTEKLEVICF